MMNVANERPTGKPAWPELPYPAWKDTCTTLQLWTQIVGKVRVALSPWLNHAWHVTLYVSARGLSTSPIPYGDRMFEIEFDFVAHRLEFRVSDGGRDALPLEPCTVAEFYRRVMAALASLGVPVVIDRQPNEISDAMAFDQDTVHAAYDADAAHRFWKILLQTHRVFSDFRTEFLGKCSPVHFFWGSFDLAVTRFSGRLAPVHPGGVPNLPDSIAREAYSHEVSSAGFWPGGGAIDYPAFYSYAYPAPAGFREARVRPDGAFFSEALGEFLLPYEVVRTAGDPDATLLAFLRDTYAAAADAANWDRSALECAPGRVRVPRSIG